MTVKTVDSKANLTANADRGPSRVIWGDCPVLALIEEPQKGMYFFDDFLMAGNAVMSSIYKNSLGAWTTYAAAGSLLDDDAKEGGCLTLTSGTDLDQTVMFSSVGAFRFVTTSTLALNQKMWFEARVAKSAIATDILEGFVGLADHQLTSSIPAVNSLFSGTDDTLATAPSFFGFYNKGDTAQTEWQLVFNLAGGTVNFPTGLTTLMNTATGAVLTANQYVKLGFVFDPAAAVGQVTSATARQTNGQLVKKLLRVFVNGIELPTFLSSADIANATATQAFPTGFLSPIFGCQQHATKGLFKIDWIRVAQVGNS